jgi:hypothetical protein
MLLKLRLFFTNRNQYHLFKIVDHAHKCFQFIDVIKFPDNEDVRAIILTSDELYLDRFVEFDEEDKRVDGALKKLIEESEKLGLYSDRENTSGPEKK